MIEPLLILGGIAGFAVAAADLACIRESAWSPTISLFAWIGDKLNLRARRKTLRLLGEIEAWRRAQRPSYDDVGEPRLPAPGWWRRPKLRGWLG